MKEHVFINECQILKYSDNRHIYIVYLHWSCLMNKKLPIKVTSMTNGMIVEVILLIFQDKILNKSWSDADSLSDNEAQVNT